MTFWRDGKIAKATVIGVFDFVLRVKPCRYIRRHLVSGFLFLFLGSFKDMDVVLNFTN